MIHRIFLGACASGVTAFVIWAVQQKRWERQMLRDLRNGGSPW